MCVPILVRSLLNVICAVSLLHGLEIWQFIGEFTLDRSLTNVMSVIGDLYEVVISASISEHIQQRRQACNEPQFVTNHKFKAIFHMVMFIFNILLVVGIKVYHWQVLFRFLALHIAAVCNHIHVSRLYSKLLVMCCHAASKHFKRNLPICVQK
jgi:hypothetical protein